MTDNLSIWNNLDKPPKEALKTIKGGRLQGKSDINPQWRLKAMTQQFGPCGIGWGYHIEERIETGMSSSERDGEKLHIAKVTLWYIWNDRRGEVEHIGATPFSGKRRSGETFLDEDAPKKSVTDALVKALSMIGFAGDIFLGRWDDQKYVASLSGQFEDHYPDEQESPERYLQETLVFIANCSDIVEMRKRWLSDSRVRQDILNAQQREYLLKAFTAKAKTLESAS